MKTKALILQANDVGNKKYSNPKLSIVSKNLSQLKPDFVRLEMIYTGLCGTDIHMTQTNTTTNHIKSTAPFSIPSEGRVLGHEGVGKILKSNSDSFKVGDYVVLESIITCKNCKQCRQGKFNQCENSLLLGGDIDGLFNNIVDVPSSICHIINNNLDKNTLLSFACIEPASVAWLSCESASLQGGEDILIFGAGPIGYFIAMLCNKIFGANKIYVVEPSKFRRDLVKKYCDKVFDVDEFFEQKDIKIDRIFEASGFLSNINKSFTKLKSNGKVILLARSGENLYIENIDYMITNALSICGVRGHLGGAFDRLIDLITNKKINLDEPITKICNSLEELILILNDSNNIENNDCKILVRLDNNEN